MLKDGVILVSKKGSMIPEALLTKVMEKHSSFMSAAVVDKRKDGGYDIMSSVQREGVDMESVTEAQELFKDSDAVFFFGSADAEIADEDIQPFVLLTDKNEDALVVAFLDGNFDNYHQTGSAFSPAHFMANKYLAGKIGKMFKACEGDLDLLAAELNDPVTKMDFENTFIGRGVVTLMLANNEIITFQKNEFLGEYPWGWTSNRYDYETAAPPATTIAEKVRHGIGKLRKVGSSEKPVQVTSSGADTSGLGTADSLEEKDESTSTVTVNEPANGEKWMGSPPPEFKSKNQKRNWYIKNEINGVVPQDYKKCPLVQVKTKEAATGVMPEAATTVKAPITGGGNGKIKDFRDMPKDQIKTVPNVSQSEPAPIMTASVREKLLKEFIPNLDMSSKQVPDPTKIQEIEKKCPNFGQQLGLSLESVLSWSVDSYQKLAREFPDAAGILLSNLRGHIVLEKKLLTIVDKTVLAEKMQEQEAVGPSSPLPAKATGTSDQPKRRGIGRNRS